MTAPRARILAWTLGIAGVVGCIGGPAAAIAIGAAAASPSFLLVYLLAIVMGLLGSLIASREPRNSIGWLMCAISLATGPIHLLPWYGYTALVTERGAWPLGAAAVWLGAWEWPVVLCIFVLIPVRFPDGMVPLRWRALDWVAVGGTALFSLAIALEPPSILAGFLPIPGEKVAPLSAVTHNVVGGLVPHTVLAGIQGTGLMLLLVAFVSSAASVAIRFRGAGGDERLQLKWFSYAGVLIAATFVYAAVAWNFFGQPLYLALTPLEFAALTLPVAIGIAILRYRLYDIDLIINRTLVYGGLTAILGAVYAAVITLLNRLFISVSGQKSDAAYVVTAFVVVVASSPIKDWLQRQVDRRVPHASPAAVLDQFRGDVEAVVSVIDVRRVARRLLDQAVAAFDARGAALYLHSSDESKPLYTRGHVNGVEGIEVHLRYEDRQLGRLVLGGRRGGLGYSQHDREALQRSADSVSEALALASHLGFRPLETRSR